ncbi:MAG TPA: NAD(P)/FAD-dependent oxidoreductase, partial [Vicinamibacterales bacterium]|nr:NAD(P)/FAD-dependent oxidoreductase [Vicinamibacterales bacterium]
MSQVTAVIVGAGQAGLAMSYCLSELGVEHVVLERGRIAEGWRSHSWDSLRLLTPNWMTRLPGFGYDGDDPDGFMSVPELIECLERYAAASGAPVVTDTTVQRVERLNDRFQVTTNRGIWSASAVIAATGYCDLPAVPMTSGTLPPSIVQVIPVDYRNPAQLPSGDVLVVGASSTGIQLADEIHRSGRPVTLAVGRHTRLPRRYRGKDIFWWLDRLGLLDQDVSTVHAIDISREQPSLQLVGSPEHVSLDLAILHGRGVRLAGRVVNADNDAVYFAEDLVATTAAADVKLADLRRRIDSFIDERGLPAVEPEPFVPTWPLAMHPPPIRRVGTQELKTVIWATGYRRAYPWLPESVLDERGEIKHERGVTVERGLYVLGLNFQQRRSSSFIHGVGADARWIAHHLAASVDVTRVA